MHHHSIIQRPGDLTEIKSQVNEVDPETFAVKADGVLATVPPAESIRVNRLYFFS